MLRIEYFFFIRNVPLFPKKNPNANNLMDLHVILQSVAGRVPFRLVADRTPIGMQKPMIHMNQGKARSAT